MAAIAVGEVLESCRSPRVQFPTTLPNPLRQRPVALLGQCNREDGHGAQVSMRK